MNYNYNEDTLIHSIGINFWRLDSILNNGIISSNKAINENINYSKNYLPDNQDQDYISFTRVGSINLEDSTTAYNDYVKNGVSFIVEDVDFLDDLSKFHHRSDEVLVKDYVSLTNIKGIIIPIHLQDTFISELKLLPSNVTRYNYIYNIVLKHCEFLKKYDGKFDMKRILDYLKELLYINNALHSIKGNNDKDSELDRIELLEDYNEVYNELNDYLGEITFDTFSLIFGRPATLIEVVKYFIKDRYEIYDLPFSLNNKQNRV